MVKITKELIERYHLNQCTAAERISVEQWLKDDFFEDEISNQDTAIPNNLESDLWNEISKTLPPESTTIVKHRKRPYAPLLAAALLLISVSLYFITLSPAPPTKYLSTKNTVIIDNNSKEVKHIEDPGYSISISPGTYANINYKSGIIDFTGSIIISARQDIELNIKGINEKLKFKAGQTYIGLMGKFPNNRTIIVSTQNLMDLPPLLQKQVVNEFRI